MGVAWYQREIEIPATWQGKRVVLHLERCHWKTSAWLDGAPLGENDSLGTPHVYPIAAPKPGRYTLTVAVDNRFIHPLGMNAHSVSDQTQTTWNGIIGAIELRSTDPVWIDRIHVYPDLARRVARVRVVAGNRTGRTHSATLRLTSQAFNTQAVHRPPPQSLRVRIEPGESTVVELEYPLGAGMQRWDEFHPALYRLEARLDSPAGSSRSEATFGMRDIRSEGQNLRLNGRILRLRGTLECAIFPLTGYPPVDLAPWKRIMRTAKAYGLNHLRFHSWFPPEAAFRAADEEGIYIHAESHLWGGVTAARPGLAAYLGAESLRLLEQYGNHASFVMFGLGNESWVERPVMTRLIQSWKAADSRRVYSGPANLNRSIIPDYDYTIAIRIGESRIRYQSGWPPKPEHNWMVSLAPQTTLDFREATAQYDKPLIAHETVERCSYPDIEAARAKYTGSLQAAYLDIARDQLTERGMLSQVRDFVHASGKWQVQQFKEEVEAALRTPGLTGFQMLALYDFPGQGSALVGVLDAFWDSKGYVTPEEFRRFCGPTVPLARMPKRSWSTADTFTAALELAHSGPEDLDAVTPEWWIADAAGQRIAGGKLPAAPVRTGGFTPLGQASLPLAQVPAPARYRLFLKAGGHENDWDIWVYPAQVDQPVPASVEIVKTLDDATWKRLEAGATVLFTPDKKALRGRIEQSFASVFWSAPWTNGGEGETLGILANPAHPVFRHFPTEGWTNWQWHDLLVNARPLILDEWSSSAPWPKDYRPVLQLIDDWYQNRKLALLAEARVGRGKLMICALDIESDLDKRVAARQFRTSLLAYLAGPRFQPGTEIGLAQVRGLLQEQ
jgi:hypothetical protein